MVKWLQGLGGEAELKESTCQVATLQIYKTGYDVVMGLCMLIKNLQIQQGSWPELITSKEKSKSQKAKIQLTGCTKKPLRQSRTY